MAPLNFNPKVIAEPDLEFGDGGRHIDPRFGLVEHGPLQPMLGDTVRIGVIGTAETRTALPSSSNVVGSGSTERTRSLRTSIRHFQALVIEIRFGALSRLIKLHAVSSRKRTHGGSSRFPSNPRQ
jgi:hypothetical protein